MSDDHDIIARAAEKAGIEGNKRLFERIAEQNARDLALIRAGLDKAKAAIEHLKLYGPPEYSLAFAYAEEAINELSPEIPESMKGEVSERKQRRIDDAVDGDCS